MVVALPRSSLLIVASIPETQPLLALNCPNGIEKAPLGALYFYRLQAGDFVQAKRLVILK